MNRDGRLMYESYSLLVELQNSEKARKLFIKKFETDAFSISDQQAGHYIEDFLAIQHKLPKDSIGPKDGKPRDLFSPYYKHLDLVTNTIQRYEGETGQTRKKDRLIEWARNHKNKLIDNEYGIAVKVSKHEESHLFGQVTKWCTTTACRKNWDRYEKEGVTFIYIVDLNQEASAKAIPGPDVDGTGFFALALYDIPWEDLYANHKEVATLPYQDDLGEYLPMAATYPHLGGDIDEWLDKITDATDDGYGRGDTDDLDYFDEKAGEIEEEFAIDFMQRWDEQTGGLNAMEAFDDQDLSVSPIAIIDHFGLPYLKLSRAGFGEKTSMTTRLERMLNASNTFQSSYKLWKDKYVPNAIPAGQSLRWPSMERKWIGWANDVVKKTKPDGQFFRPDHNAYVAGPSWRGFKNAIFPYMESALEGKAWPALETYFGNLRQAAISNFFRLSDYIQGGTHQYPNPASLELTWKNKDSVFYGQAHMSELKNTIQAGSAYVNVYTDIFPFMQAYFEKFERSPEEGTVWTPGDEAWGEWDGHILRMGECIELSSAMADVFINHFDENDAHYFVDALPQFIHVDQNEILKHPSYTHSLPGPGSAEWNG